MKLYFLQVISMGCFFICTAFSLYESEGINRVYGVSSDNPNRIELKLNADYTFTYHDHSSKNNKIDMRGVYEYKNGRVFLIPTQKDITFHTQWHFSVDGEIAKSRKGLCWYTLNRLE